MIKIIRRLLLLTLVFSQFAWADCGKLLTNKNFNVVFEINNAGPDELVTASKKNGDNPRVLWSDNSRHSPMILDGKYDSGDKIEEGGNYHVWLEYKTTSNKHGDLLYYLYEKGTYPAKWNHKDTYKNANLSSIISTAIKVTGGNVDNLSCSTDGKIPELPEEPEPTSYDICEYVPDVVQSNKYYRGNINGNLSISGNSYISTIDPKHGYSFLPEVRDISGCKYNSDGTSGNKEKCAPVEPKENEFPSLLEFKKSKKVVKCEDGKSCAISSDVYKEVIVEDGETITLSPGEYWIEEFKVEDGSQVIISDSKQTVIHFQYAKLEENSKVNKPGNSENLLLIGYGEDDDDILQLEKYTRLYGYVYLDPKVGSLDIEKEDAVIIGGVTAPVIEISAGAIIGSRSQCGRSTTKRYLVAEPTEKYALTCDRDAPAYTVKMMLDTSGDGSADTLDSAFNGPITIEKQPNQSVCLLPEGDNNCVLFDGNNKAEINAVNGLLALKVKPPGIGEVVLKASTPEAVENTLPITSTFRFMPYMFEILPMSSVGKNDELIAGKPEDVTIGVLACTTPENGEPEYIADYQPSTTKPIQISTGYDAPSTGSSAVTISKPLKFTNGKAELGDALAYGDAGKVTFTLKDPAFGKKEYCKGSSECEGLFPSGSSGLEGSATIYVRPYTFALCDIKNPDDSTPRVPAKDKTNHSGTSEGGLGFAAAGEAFEARLKPVIWLAGDALSKDHSGDNKNDIKASGSSWCARTVTENYYASTGSPVTINAPVSLSIPSLPASPDSTDKSKLDGGKLGGTKSYRFTKKVTGSGWLTPDLTWSEVGSLWLQADAVYQVGGRSLVLDQGTVQIGRFYPAHFVLKESALSNAVNNTFTYMNQGFEASFTVEAQNKGNKATNNYGLFNSAFKEELELVAIDSQVTGNNKNDLTPRLDTSLLQKDPTKPNFWAKYWQQATLALSSTELGLKRDTSPDGPYPLHLGLLVKKRDNCSDTGCTDFSVKNLDQRVESGATPAKATKLNGEIDARYGRMRMEDVTVPATQDAEVPVMAEYYQSSSGEFILNQDDTGSSASRYGSNYGCSELIFPDSMSSSLNDGNDHDDENVTEGRGVLLVDHPTGVADGYREQIRLGQRLSLATPSCTSPGSSATSNQPWLQYNWAGEGDTDPSAVVTFGVYRGNDRIIYRGEKGINTLLN